MANGITAITDLKNRVMPELPGCPAGYIEQVLKDVMRDFCVQTECWTEEISQTLTEDETDYTLTPTATDADIMRIAWVKIKSTATDVVDDLYEQDTAHYKFDGVDALTLATSATPTATVATGLVTKVVLAPKINSATWAAGLMNRWADAIVAGVLAKLMANKKESWGDPERAKDERNTYWNKIGLARFEALRGFKTGSVSTTVREWP